MTFFGTGINFGFSEGISIAPFVPTGTPAAHFSADTIEGLSNADAVVTWEDQTANNKDFTQANPALRGLYKTDIHIQVQKPPHHFLLHLVQLTLN